MAAPPPLRFGPYQLDGASGHLWRHSQLVKLPPKATAVLWCLASQAGQVVSKATLLDTVWAETAVSEGVLAVCIRDLRRALGDAAQQPRYIETVHRRGYRFVAPVVALPEPLAAPGGPRALPPVARPAAPLAPSWAPGLVGRVAELAQMQAGLGQALRGQRQVVLLSGEAGLGKTTVVDAFLATLAPDPPVWVAWGQGLAHYGTGEAYLPVLDALGRLGRVPGHARLLGLLRQYAPTWVGQLPALFSAADLEAVPHQGQGATRERMLREAAEVLEAVSLEQPLVLVLEDLHWSDHATLDLLSWLARRREPARLLVLGTYRPGDVLGRGHPLQAVTQELVLHGQCVELRLAGLSAAEVTAYVTGRFPGSAVAAQVAGVLHRRTEGQPLFMVQTVDAWVQQGWVAEVAGQWAVQVAVAVVETGVAESVRQMIAQQYDALPPAVQAVLEAASVVGATFSAAAVAAGLDCTAEAVEAQCAALGRRGQFVRACGVEAWPDGTVAGRYAFVHALYQQVVYERLLVGQRVRLHRQIGGRLEAGYQEQARAHAAELALHFECGHESARVVPYLQQAAENAARRHAHHEVIALVTKGLELLAMLPETPARAQQELALQLALGPALIATKGSAAPEVEQTYTRARALCAQVGEMPQIFPALRGLWHVAFNRGALPAARELGEQLDRLAQRTADPTHRLEAHYALGNTLFFLGDYPAARTHCEQGIARIDHTALPPQALYHSVAPGVGGLTMMAHTLWCLGYPAQAMRRSQEAQALAQALAHPYSLAYTQYYAARLHYRRRDVPAVQAQAEALLTLATAQGFPLWVELGTFWRGWALAMQGQGEAGLAQMHQGMAALLAIGMTLMRPVGLVLLAEATEHTGQVAAGQRLLAEALTAFEASGHGDLLAEAYRLQGVLLLQQAVPDPAQAEACFQQALTVARRQQAKSWELRVALSLARLWQRQGQHAAAYELLAPVYHWFTEGFDTADLQEAKALLEALRS